MNYIYGREKREHDLKKKLNKEKGRSTHEASLMEAPLQFNSTKFIIETYL